VTAGREMLTLTFMASLASPNKSSMESIMLWSWTSVSLMSFMEVSTPELSMMAVQPNKKTAMRCTITSKNSARTPSRGCEHNNKVYCCTQSSSVSSTTKRDDPAQGPHARHKVKRLRLTGVERAALRGRGFTGLKMPGYVLGVLFEMEWQPNVISLCVWAGLGVDGDGSGQGGGCPAGKAALALSIQRLLCRTRRWSGVVDRRHGHTFQNNAGSRINMQLSPPLAPAAQRHSSSLLLFCLPSR
jgi:hypothetical protein